MIFGTPRTLGGESSTELAQLNFVDEMSIEVDHNLGVACPTFIVRDADGEEIITGDTTDNGNTLTINFFEPLTGTLTYLKLSE